ncbi:hypothetical protein BOSE62_150424 [Bosea sp. 62]|nr:hypothetical protein BOSE46_10419 [Bosea sp. 46]CAD5250283.1 hypothetical protein BOSE21B_10632 [Bosea sp. 21B]CAD5264935.1 hypothetical protein BOSE7B_150505 [Bosea sp. 7B]VVT44343.1 hypothetical protein BOS5A_10440 [Bosea sp. EC-HK365B]VXB09850.1 hypothetical protein BOSE29B_10415 [Bosea sp. 29B]VXB82734.1 hypothetical protein BOSE62_150424 [Bosea sp. 62]VXC32063.1 hypothetical protein BOSE125_20098 [Bosea sp. 125]VXC44861.1 hypothetical protein BOSE127_190132 [Bosea sp. 127]
MEEEVRRASAGRDAPAEAARGREREAAQARRRLRPGPRDAAGRHSPKALRPGRKRELVGAMCGEWQVSIRRACAVLEFDTSSYHYKSCRPDQAPLAARIKAICETRVRYGYRRVDVLLRREGWHVNQKRIRRIYNELGLQLRNKTPKRRVKAPRFRSCSRRRSFSTTRKRPVARRCSVSA